MSDIPEARKIIMRCMNDLRHIAKEIERAEGMMYRADSKRRAPMTRRRVSKALAKEVKDFVRLHPEMPQEQIAARFNIDGGRVSKIINGKFDGKPIDADDGDDPQSSLL